MVPDVEIKFEEKKLRRVQTMLRDIPKKMPQVMSRAINRTATSARTEIVKRLVLATKFTPKAVRKSISLKKATYKSWLARIGIYNHRIPLIHFGARQTKKGVSYKGANVVYRGKDEIARGGTSIKSAFKQVMPQSGHKRIFMRTFKERLPIKELFGPSIGEVFEGAAGIAKEATRDTHKKLEKNIDDQIGLLLSRKRGTA